MKLLFKQIRLSYLEEILEDEDIKEENAWIKNPYSYNANTNKMEWDKTIVPKANGDMLKTDGYAAMFNNKDLKIRVGGGHNLSYDKYAPQDFDAIIELYYYPKYNFLFFIRKDSASDIVRDENAKYKIKAFLSKWLKSNPIRDTTISIQDIMQNKI